MTRKDWICLRCKTVMIRMPESRYIVCCGCDGRLRGAFGVMDLPLAVKAYLSGSSWVISGGGGLLWEYVPHAHKNALDHAPAEGVMVARVRGKRGGARSFKLTKGSRKALVS